MYVKKKQRDTVWAGEPLWLLLLPFLQPNLSVCIIHRHLWWLPAGLSLGESVSVFRCQPKITLFAFMSAVLRDVFELFWRDAVRYRLLPHSLVALPSLGASQAVCAGARGREPGHGEDRVRREGLFCLVGDRVLYSTGTSEPLRSAPETSITTAAVAGFYSVDYSVLTTTEPRQHWTCKTFEKFNHL